MRIYSEKTVWLLSFYFSVQNIQKTHAYHRLQDDVPAEVKQRRLQELIAVFREEAARVNGSLVGSTQLVLVEGVSTAPSALTALVQSDSYVSAAPYWTWSISLG